MLFDILDYNVNLFIENISKKFNIDCASLQNIKSSENIYIRLEEKTLKIHNDLYGNKYIIINNSDISVNDEYFAVKMLN
tara:strand:- start:1996 stop:2232 length:237 start_codon:yes stop_codon:yes gene_type:complete